MIFTNLLEAIRKAFRPVYEKDMPDQLSSSLASDLELWGKMYANEPDWLSKSKGIYSINLSSTIASEFARLVTSEMEVTISGGARSEYVERQLSRVLRNMRQTVEVGCALGGIVFKPYVVGDEIYINAVQADRFIPTRFDSDSRLTGGIFIDQIVKGENIFTRAEIHDFKVNTETVINKAFISKSSLSLGREISLTDVPEWADIEPEVAITNLSKPLFAYFRVPMVNAKDRYTPLGASVYSRAVDLIERADIQFGQMLWEYEGGQLAVDVAEDLLNHGNEYLKPKVPQMQERLYRSRAVSLGDESFYQVFAPQLRDESYLRGFNALLQRIEFACNLAYGTLSDPQEATSKTATEILLSKQRSYSAVVDIQKELELALLDLVDTIEALADLYQLAPRGETVEVSFDWGDAVTDSPIERKTMFWNYVLAGKFPFWRYLVEFEGYTEEEAKEIEAESAAGFDLFPRGT